jgi:DNA modification methylase
MTCGRKIGDFDCCSVVCGDCLELMRSLPDGCVDAVITDPPYGMGYSPISTRVREGKRKGSANTYHAAIDWDESLNPEWMQQCQRVSSSVAWFCNWRMWPQVVEMGGNPTSMIVWAKDCHTGAPCPLAPQQEIIGIFGELKPTRFETNVWFEPIIPTWEYRHHPNEKPLALMARLISLYPDGVLLDPFAGSGSTLVAAKKLGRHYLGFEISPEYYSIARKRIAAVEAQPNLFQPKAEQLNMEGL